MSVTDHAAALPQRRSPDGGAEGGRGLNLIDHTSDSWGVEPRALGKSLWFRLAGA